LWHFGQGLNRQAEVAAHVTAEHVEPYVEELKQR
jgi:hypothetical protein